MATFGLRFFGFHYVPNRIKRRTGNAFAM